MVYQHATQSLSKILAEAETNTVVQQEQNAPRFLADSLLFELWDCLSDYEASSGLSAQLRHAFATALRVERVLESADGALAATLKGRYELAKHTAKGLFWD